MINSLASVSPEAELGQDVFVGPFSVIERDVRIGDGCQLAGHVVVKEGTTLGEGNRLFEGAVIGGLPQHVEIPDRPGELVIGRHNVIREYCTIHRSLAPGSETRIGDHNLLMVGSHVAHDCQLRDHVILTSSVLLAGHVEVHDRAYLSGAVAVHQFCRIGRNAMVGGHARILKDVPPFVTVDGGTSLIVGLNRIGMRRSGVTDAQIRELRAAYAAIYRRGLIWREVLETLRQEFPHGIAAEFTHFFAAGTRGFTQERRSPPNATIKLHDRPRSSDDLATKAG